MNSTPLADDEALTNDVAEMRRVLNSFLQYMEEENSTDSLIIGATNHPDLLDTALLRRFDLVAAFQMPSHAQIKQIILGALRPFKSPRLAWKDIYKAAEGLSQAEITRATEDAVKSAILGETNIVTSDELIQRLANRRAMQKAFSNTQPG